MKVGQTSSLVANAPRNAIFVCNDMNHVAYVRHLAKHMNRDDLRIVPVSWVTERKYLGIAIETPVVVDHAVNNWSKEFSDLKRRSRVEK